MTESVVYRMSGDADSEGLYCQIFSEKFRERCHTQMSSKWKPIVAIILPQK